MEFKDLVIKSRFVLDFLFFFFRVETLDDTVFTGVGRRNHDFMALVEGSRLQHIVALVDDPQLFLALGCSLLLGLVCRPLHGRLLSD